MHLPFQLIVMPLLVLHLPAFRYVDDFFAGERRDTAKHAMEVFARLVRALLGKSAIASRKLEHGKKLVILGVQDQVRMCAQAGFNVGMCFCDRWRRPARVSISA